MEGDKHTEEKEEEDEKQLPRHMAAASSVDYQDLPMMHWEELSQRIAELEKQEQERRDRAKGGTVERTEGGPCNNIWEEEDLRRCWVTAVTSRFHDHGNLQLCFINNSDSEDDEEGSNTKVTGHGGCRAAGLKQEVATALRTLRDKLLEEQKEEELASSSSAKRKHLELWELQESSVQQLSSLRASLQQEIHALSSELVAHLLVRDRLRTRQDAMLLDVQDLT